MQVIPAINAPDLKTAEKQIRQAAEFSDWVHLDITDSIFSPAKIWGTPAELSGIKYQVSSIKFEAHLMVQHPEKVIEDWLKTRMVKRVIVHVEAVTDEFFILAKCKEYGAEAMLAANPDTPVERLLKHKDDFKYFQLLGVKPGWAGQKFDSRILEKIRFLRKNLPNATPHLSKSEKYARSALGKVRGAIIEIDGGVNPKVGKQCKDAGADILVSASYIFGSDDPKKAYEELKL